MKNIKIIVVYLLILSVISVDYSSGAQPTTKKTSDHAIAKNYTPQLITFDLNGDKLLDIVNRLAGLRQVNILLPGDQKKLNDTTVTFHLPYKITSNKAWDLMLTMLDIAGYSIITHGNNLYEIIANNAIGNSPAPLYINTKTDLIKNGTSTIRYLYYFQNIPLKEKDIKSNLEQILKDMINAQQPEQNFIVDENHNSLLITNKANTIKSIINIIQELDQGGFREAIEVVPIIHVNANEIVDIITKLIPTKKDEDTFRFPPLIAEPKNSKTYFSASTRIIAIDQTNSVAIFGLYESVQRIKDFIQKYLDKSVDAEKTVLHVKPLRYLDSVAFATTLDNLIKQKSSTAQSSGKSSDKILNDVRVQAEQSMIASPVTERKLESTEKVGVEIPTGGGEEKKGPFIGGNNLIIAATHRDWKIIEKLIDDTDTPQWQVALEVLVVDMTISTGRAINTQLRRIANDNLSHEFKWQSAQAQMPALDYTVAKPPYGSTDINSTAGLEADLSSMQPPDVSGGANYTIPGAEAVGSTVFTYQDKHGTAAILSILDNYDDVKVISRPFVITKNNQQANIFQREMRYVQGTVDPKTFGGTPVTNYEALAAAIKVTITPRISRVADNINLEVRVDANEFVGTSDVITERTVVTNANVGNKSVLVLGGITKTTVEDFISGVPILSKIPIIGTFFKSQTMDYAQRNLVIFICPTRIPPVDAQKLTGPNQFTQDKVDDITGKFINTSEQFACLKKSENFQCLTDPITTFIFPYPGEIYARFIQDYNKRYIWEEETKGKTSEETKKKIQEFGGKTQNGNNSTDKLKEVLAHEENPLKKQHKK
jgi:general secretion pathway protein D